MNYLVTFVVSFLFFAQLSIAQTSDSAITDSLARAKTQTELNEVVVEGNRTYYKGDTQVIIPGKEQIATSGSAFDLLKKLPLFSIQINDAMRKITSILPGEVQVRINHIIANKDDLANLNVENVKKVEYIQNPGMRYGDNVAAVIDIIMSKRTQGLTLGTNMTDAATANYGNNDYSASLIKGNSELSLSYSLGFENFNKMKTNEHKSYLMPDNSVEEVSYTGLPSTNKTFTHNIQLKYNLSVLDKYVFQVQLYTGIKRNPKQESSQIIEEAGQTSRKIQSNIKDEYTSPALDLYYQISLPQKQQLIVNAVGTYRSSNYDYQYTDNDYKLNTHTNGKKYSLISEAIYEKEMEKFTFTSGLKSEQSYTDNTYNSSDTSVASMHNNNIYAYLQLSGKWKKFNYRLATGVNYQYYSQNNASYEHWSFRPELSLNYAINQRFRVNYNFILRPVLPSLNNLNDAEVQKNEREIRAGNANLKPFQTISNAISFTYSRNRINAQMGATYMYCKNAIMGTVTRRITDDGDAYYIYGVDNHRSMNQLNVQSDVRYEIIPKKLALSGYGGVNFFYCNGNTFEIHKSYYFGELMLENYIGKLYLSAGMSNRYISLFAETAWYDAYSNFVNATYNWGNIQIGVRWDYPFQKNGNTPRQRLTNQWVQSTTETINSDESNRLLLTFVWRWHTGQKSKAKDKIVENRDSGSGILKNK